MRRWAVSERAQQILSDVRELTDEEEAQLETELLAADVVANRAWALFAMSPADARARLAALLDPARR